MIWSNVDGLQPIRKTAPNRVALTSYYGKIFVTRSRKNSDNLSHWLQNQVMLAAVDKENKHITNAAFENAFEHGLKAPLAYSAVSSVIKSATIAGFNVSFSHAEVLRSYPPVVVSHYEKNGMLLLGTNNAGGYLLIDQQGAVYQTQNNNQVLLGSLAYFLGIPVAMAPVDYATAGIFGKDIPVGVILGLELGFDKLVSLLNATMRRVPIGQRTLIQDDEYALTFSDESLVFKRSEGLAAMVLSGFNEYRKTLKLFSVYSFNKRGVYVNLLETNGIGIRFVREVDLANKMFVDPITRDILIEMKEPTTYRGLLFRSCEMLLSSDHPQELDPAFMRIKGYERFAGSIYSELIQSLRTHNGSLGKANAAISMNPYAIWKKISEDPSKAQVSEINPIASLKEAEAVTYGGEGGRGRVSMTKNTRSYHKNDMGTISEATVDSGDVAINIYTSADPQFTSLRGMSKRFDLTKPNITSLMSTSALLAPAAHQDDARRCAFISIQQQHSIACDGYHQAAVRTGYESVLAHRTSSLYAYTAKKKGVVREVSVHGVLIDYDDGESEGYETGRRFGNSQGLTVAHNVITHLKKGDPISVGSVVVYNDSFFEPDFFDEKKICWKNSLNARTVLWEATQTHEDSSVISKRLSSTLASKVTKVKTVTVAFEQSISNLVKLGDHVDGDTRLCILEDGITANNKLFDSKSIETLMSISAQTPRANVNGVVEKIELFYHGELADMSESLKELATATDLALKKKAQGLSRMILTGKVDGGFRLEGNPLALDTLAIRIYITHDVGAGVGD